MKLVSGWTRCDANTFEVGKSEVIYSADAKSADAYFW